MEIDVQEDADGQVVVLHDSDFMKVAKNNLKISEATSAELNDIDVGSWFDAKFAKERVPLSLSNCSDYARGKSV